MTASSNGFFLTPTEANIVVPVTLSQLPRYLKKASVTSQPLQRYRKILGVISLLFLALSNSVPLFMLLERNENCSLQR
jgi:hypothetical protein